MYKLISLFCAVAFLGGCVKTIQNPIPVKNKTNKTTNQVLPPKYLSIDGFKACLDTQTKGSAVFYCMPNAKPDACSDESWTKLNELEGKEKLPVCGG